MPWYGWLPWILFVVITAAFIIYLVVKKPKTSAELREQLATVERDYKAMKADLIAEKVARQNAEKDRAVKELALLELQHSDKLKELKEKEKTEYEAAKKNPQGGIDYINAFLGGESSGGNG